MINFTNTIEEIRLVMKPRERNRTGFVVHLLGAFAKFRKATISFIMSVRPSAHMEQLGSHWTDFHEILYLRNFRISVEKIFN
jgi:hypothetical protein